MDQISENDVGGLLFFASLSPNERRDMARRMTLEVHAANDVIIEFEEQTTDVFFVLEGELEIAASHAESTRVLFEKVSAGEYFGEFSAIDGEPRSATVRARSKCRLLRMKREVFLGLLLSHPKLAIRLMERLVAIIRNVNAKVVNMATLTVVERLHRHFLAKGVREESGVICVKDVPNQSVLAAEIGSSRETVSRAMNKLISEQMVVRDGRNYFVRPNGNLRRDVVE